MQDPIPAAMLVSRLFRRASHRTGIACWVLALSGLLLACEQPAPSRPDPASIQYVGREVCAECHQEEDSLWQGSHHDLAMQPATEETVLADFNEATFTQSGITTRFFRDGDRFMVHTEGPEGDMETFEVSYTFGYEPLQQYMVEFPDGRVQVLTIAWDTERNEWFSLYPGERIPADDWLHWTKAGMNWNYMCADCHSTNLQKNYDLETDTYSTTWSEINVSCEACHGPGDAHVKWAREFEESPDRARVDDRWLGLTVRMKDRVHARQQIETCAPCHSRRRVLSADFFPGDEYLDHYEPELLDENLYFADGKIKDEVYVYASFLQSKMYHEDVRCSDCHDSHSTKLRLTLEDNALCLQCHEYDIYDVVEHHFHPGEDMREATQCVACHMRERTYMVVDPRRDHSFQIPRPDLTVEIGVPNACNAEACHPDQTAAWSAQWVEEWYGPERPNEPHFARAFAAGRADEPEAIPALIDLANDGERPAIIRATALSLLGRYAVPEAEETAENLLDDSEPLVRTEAIRSLEQLPPEEVDRLVAHLVEDTVLLVRTEAARVLAQTGRYAFDTTPTTDRSQSFQNALAEYRRTQEVVNDQAAAHLNLGVLHEQADASAEAERAYRTALRIDSSFVPAHLNLAMLYNRMRMAASESGSSTRARDLMEAAERQLREALRLEPGMAEAHYTLGLLLAEDPQRLPEAAEQLAAAARLSPRNARMQYNAGLSYQHLNVPDSAEVYLRAAHEIDPEHPDYLNALSILYVQQEAWQPALEFTEALAERYPDAQAVQQRLSYVQAQL